MTSGSTGLLRPLAANVGLVLAGMLAMVAVFYGAASLDVAGPAQRLAEAFDDGTLSHDVGRELEVVPGFVVMESDYEGACVSYSHMLSPAEDLFGLGMRPQEPIYGCTALDATVHAALGQDYSPYYRYWQGAAAFSRIALSVISVFWWQVLLTVMLLGLIAALTWRTWKYSRTYSTGVAVICLLVVDFPWHGMSPLHGVSTVFGLSFALLALTAFQRRWTVRWGVAVLAGATYAMVAHTLIPAAFAMLVAMMAMLPLLRAPERPTTRSMSVGIGAGILWFAGYALATAARAAWVAIWGPGPEEVINEWTGTGGGFLISSWVDPFYQTLGLLMKTWFGVGFMQVGLMLFFAVLGWSLAKGGARAARSRVPWVAASPILLGVGWLIVWANHTNHTFVHVVPGIILLTILFASEVGRALETRDYTLKATVAAGGIEQS